MKSCKIFGLLALVLCLLFAGCSKDTAEPETTTPPAVSSEVPTSSETQTQATQAFSETTKAPETTTQSNTFTAGGQTYTVPEKSGDMLFTDDSENKFICAVAEKYGVDAKLLACIYASPSSDNNFVWQFNGKTDSSGKLVRNPDTLKYVYIISADCNTIARTGGLSGNDGMSLAAGVLLMQTTKQLMIPEFQDQLNA